MLVGSDPVGDFPDRGSGRRRPSGAPASWWRWTAFSLRRRRWPTWCSPWPSPTSGRGRPPTSRVGSRAWPRSWCHRASAGRTGWSPPSSPTGSAGAWASRARPSCGTRSSGWRRRTPGSPGSCSTPPRPATASSPRCPPLRCGSRRAAPWHRSTPWPPRASMPSRPRGRRRAPGRPSPPVATSSSPSATVASSNGGAPARPRSVRWPRAGRGPCAPGPRQLLVAARVGSVGSTTTACWSRRAVPSPRWRLRPRCGPIPTTSGPSGSPTRHAGPGPFVAWRRRARGRRRRRGAPRRGLHRLQPPRPLRCGG